MGFRDREKSRLAPLKADLFSKKACEWGSYGGRKYEFCLSDDRVEENLHRSIRDEALRYFKERGIKWHRGIGVSPSNHLCCSQSCCVNFWMPFMHAPKQLARVLRGLGYDVAEVLPFSSDGTGTRNIPGYVAFEWIGERNYLGELARGTVAGHDGRTRGAGFTSLDLGFRFRRSDGGLRSCSGNGSTRNSTQPAWICATARASARLTASQSTGRRWKMTVARSFWETCPPRRCSSTPLTSLCGSNCFAQRWSVIVRWGQRPCR